MPYIIYDNNNYVAQDFNGRFFLACDIGNAKTWHKVQKATNVCKEISRTFKGHDFKVKCVSEFDILGNSQNTGNCIFNVSNNISGNEDAGDQQNKTRPTTLDYDIFETASEFHSLIKQARERRPYIERKIKDIELEITDIEHAAEFYNLNASQGYKLYKLLHNARIERRKLKDNLAKIDMLLDVNVNVDAMEVLRKRLLGMDNRKYTPRINNELFGV